MADPPGNICLGRMIWIVLLLLPMVLSSEASVTSAANKKGRRLKIVTILSPPFTFIEEDAVSRNVTYVGYVPDVVKRIADLVDFEYDLYLVKDSKYGNYDNVTKKWNGMIGDLKKWEESSGAAGADMAAAPLVIASMREAHVDYVHAVMHNQYVMLASKVARDNTIHSFHPFNHEDWLILPGVYIIAALVAVCLWGIHRLTALVRPVEGNEEFGIGGCFWFIFTTLNWQGFSSCPKPIGARLLSVTWLGFAFIFVMTYIAMLATTFNILTTMSVSPYPREKFKTLGDLVLRKPDYLDYGTMKGSGLERFIKSAPGSLYHTMVDYWSDSMLPTTHFVRTTEEGIDRVRKERHYVFLLQESTARYYSQRLPCDLEVIGEPFGQGSYGFALPPNHPLEEKINHAVLKLQETGELEAIERKWWYDIGQCGTTRTIRPTGAMSYQAGMTFMLPVWILMGTGVSLSILLTLVDVLLIKFRGKGLSGKSYNKTEMLHDQQEE